MKKSYFWGLLLAIMALIPAQNAFADYCTYSGTITRKDSYTTDFTITDGVNSKAVTNIQENVGTYWSHKYNVYIDKTSEVFETSSGATLHFSSFNYSRNWAMYAYVYIDYNNDEVFDINGGELVAKTPGGTCKATDIPSWTIPADLETGTYRMRVKVEWDNTDPCGGVSLVNDGGTMCDMSIKVVRGVPERTISVNVTPDGAGTVTGAGTAAGNITLTATPNSGYGFVNWTLNGEVVGADLSYIDATEGDKTYVANFAVLTAYPEMSILYSNGASQANRYLKEVTAVAGETTTTVFSATSESELPKVDPNVIGSPTTTGACVDKTSTPIVVPEGTTEFSVNFKAWTTAMSVSGTTANCELNWTQQAAFIDWNNNFYFYDENENYGKSSNTIGNDGEVCASFISEGGYTRTFTVPAGIQPGVYRMRVCYNEPDGGNDQQWQNTLFEKGNCTTRNGKTYDFAVLIRSTSIAERVITLEASPAEGGVVKANGNIGGVTAKDVISIEAVANDGYRFVEWKNGETVVSTSSSFNDETAGDKTYIANFVKVYNVTTTATNGTVQVSGQNSEGTFDEGSNVTIEAVAAPGYVFKNWVIDGGASGDTNPFTFLVTEDYEIEAVFEKTYFTDFGTSTNADKGALTSITFNIDGNVQTLQTGKTSSSGAIYVDKISEVITIEAGTQVNSLTTEGQVGNNWMHGYLFVDWNGDKSFTRDLNEWVPTDESELIAYGFWVGQDGDGSHGNVNDNTGYNHLGEVLTEGSRATNGVLKAFTIPANIPAGDYRARYKLDWNCINPDATLDTNQGAMVLDFTLRVTQPVPPTYAVSVATADEAMGTAEVSATEVQEGEEVTFTATVKEGYQFVNWTSGEEVVSIENPYKVAVTAEMALTANFVAKEFTVTYKVGGVTILTETYAFGKPITPSVALPEKEGYTFIGWGEIPATMPAEDIELNAQFSINSYDIVYIVDGGEYTTETYEFGATITPIAEPTKEGYTFSGWSEIPATMPAENVEVTGTFSINSYDIVYIVDGEEYATEKYEFGATITPVAAPTKAGYTFSGWSEIPATMPAEDVTVTGTFTVNSYEIVYIVDGEEHATETYEFGATITPIAEPTKAGYTFSGWSEIPATMPAEDVTVTGTFTEIIKEDVVVTDGNREENANATYANVTVANEKVWDIKANTISADKVSVSVSATGAAPQIKIKNGGQVTAALEVNRVVKKGEWAMMALPFAVDLANVTVDGVAAQNNVNIKVMVYDAAKRADESIENWTISGWVDLQGTTIAANQGFAVAVNAQNGDEQTVTFASALQTYDGTDKEVALDRHASTVNAGADADWNFFGNPTLANAEKGAGYALYIYNAEDDSYDEYASSDVIACQPYAAMFVQSADNFNTLGFSNGTAGILNDANGVFGEMQFSLNGDDEARVVLSDEASEEYVRNEDALYFAAPNANLAQLYIVKGNIKMAVSEQPELSESIALGYKAAKAGEQTLTLTSLPDNASVVLKDNVTGDEVALTVGDSYTFESAAGTFNNRFVVTTTDLTGIAQATTDGDIKVIVKGDEISVYGAEAGAEVVAYTTNGMVVASAVAAEGVTTLATSANGVIIVKVANAAVKVVK